MNCDFLSFYLNGNNYSIRQWTKKSLLNEFNMNYDSEFINQPQIEAGCIFIKSSADSLFFIKQWQHYSTTNNYLYSNDIISNFEDDLFIINIQSYFAITHGFVCSTIKKYWFGVFNIIEFFFGYNPFVKSFPMIKRTKCYIVYLFFFTGFI
jgi:hypothetical protein